MALNAKELKRPGKGSPPQPMETTQNLVKPPSVAQVPLQVHIDAAVKLDFEIYAKMHGYKPYGQLFEKMFQEFKERHP
jgi:hypothetical protein